MSRRTNLDIHALLCSKTSHRSREIARYFLLNAASLLASHDRYACLVGNGSGHGPALISLLSARSEQLRRAIH
jgi:hypothetical protein